MHAEDYFVHLNPFRSIYAFRSEHILLGRSFGVTAWTQMISVIFYISFFMLRSHYCPATVMLSVEMCSKSLGPNFCCIMFISAGGLKDFQSSLNILSGPTYRNMHRGLFSLRSIFTLQRIWHWNELHSGATWQSRRFWSTKRTARKREGICGTRLGPHQCKFW